MRIFSYEINKSFDEIFIYLAPDEIKELISYLEHLIQHPQNHHIHLSEINLNEVKREITFSIYTNDNINEFDERSRKLLLEGKSNFYSPSFTHR